MCLSFVPLHHRTSHLPPSQPQFDASLAASLSSVSVHSQVSCRLSRVSRCVLLSFESGVAVCHRLLAFVLSVCRNLCDSLPLLL